VCVASPTCGCTSGKCTTCGTNGLPCCSDKACQFDQGFCEEEGPDGGLMCRMMMGP
jgi:hypothetical protein